MLLERYGRPAEGLERKSSSTDPVSDADRAAEDVVRELLARERPDDGLLAEEGSHADSASGRRWVVDPLDGTVNYLYGFPAWCVSVALENASGGLVGVVHNPLADETVRAMRGGGCELNGRSVRVRDRDDPSRSLIATGFAYDPERRAAQAEVIARVLPAVRDIRRAGAAAWDLASVAVGRLDGYFERGLSPWDWAAGRLLVEEAGGTVLELPDEPHGLVAANAALAPRLLALITE